MSVQAVPRRVAALGTLLLILCPGYVSAIGACPPIGQSPSCAVLITIGPTGRLRYEVDPSIGPYDGDEDTLIGVQNQSGATVFGIHLSGNGIFDFDGDGANSDDYAGPDTSFTIESHDSGTVNFDKGLEQGKFLWFSLEGAPAAAKLGTTVTLDPGHGFDCASVGQPLGATGATNYPANNPPSGFLHEDILSVNVVNALAPLMSAAGYTVAVTKTDAASCPRFEARGEIANNAHSNAFVSVHFNAPLSILPGLAGIYTAAKSDSQTLASLLQSNVSLRTGLSALGLQNRTDLAVLKPTVTRMTAAIIEVARLSGFQEEFAHDPANAALAAAGIRSGIDAFVRQ